MALNIYNLLCGRYSPAEYVVMSEVSDAAGHQRSRSADFIVVGLWNSRGLPVIGIELKSFRGDWLKELKNPAKAENIYQYCDNFYLLTTEETVAKIEEIPVTWGWLCIKGERIKVMKEAPRLEPKPLSKSFVVCMLKRSASKEGWVRLESIQDKIEEVRTQVFQQFENSKNHDQRELIELKKEVKEFEDAAEIKFGSWNSTPKSIGKAYKLIEKGGLAGIEKELKRYKEGAEHLISIISGVLEIPENPEKVIE